MRCEWAKSKACMDRWNEEIILVKEEMRRVVCFLGWKSDFWGQLSNAQKERDECLTSALAAYAAKQGYVNNTLASRCIADWYPAFTTNDFMIEWPSTYTPTL
jgi:hypothetical protein